MKVKKIIQYSDKNISQYYLSPYVRMFAHNGKVYIKQWLFSKEISIKCNEGQLLDLFSELEEGLTKDLLIQKLAELFGTEAQLVLLSLLKNGIIE